MDHIGIDVHKRESQIYILAEEGEIIGQGPARTTAGQTAAGCPRRAPWRRSAPEHEMQRQHVEG
jgi:hypothetical protein